jgi:preprotein translocase subunit SecA
VQRGRDFALVDEADQVMLDFGRTPYVMARPLDRAPGVAEYRAKGVAAQLLPGEHYAVGGKDRITLTRAGRARADALAPGRGAEVVQALVAERFYTEGVHYIRADGRIQILDRFTGRPLTGQRWRDGLHEAIEAKENVPVGERQAVLDRTTTRLHLQEYRSVGGMTGTTVGTARAFGRLYGLRVVVLEGGRPAGLRVLDTAIYASAEQKFAAVVAETARARGEGQPVGSISGTVRDVERLAAADRRVGVAHDRSPRARSTPGTRAPWWPGPAVRARWCGRTTCWPAAPT